MKCLYALARTSACRDPSSSSNMSKAACISFRKVSVQPGCLALGVIFIFGILECTISRSMIMRGILAIFSFNVLLYLILAHCNIVYVRCFYLRTQWYSHQSNKCLMRFV